MELNNVLLAFGLTLFAGLATGVGSALAFFTKTTNTRFLSGALGFSAGVMIYVSMVEIFFKARNSLQAALGDTKGYWLTVVAFFGGMLVVGIIDKFVPSFQNPHEPRMVEEMSIDAEGARRKGELMRMGMFSALAIGIHNFPEGLATFTSALKDPALGLSIAIAIVPKGSRSLCRSTMRLVAGRKRLLSRSCPGLPSLSERSSVIPLSSVSSMTLFSVSCSLL